MQGSRYYMKDEVPFQDFPAYSEKSTNRKPLIVFLVLLILIGAGVGGLFILGSDRKDESQVTAPTQAPIPTEEPTATPVASVSGTISPTIKLSQTPSSSSASLDRKTVRVAVLNGSGVAGAGKKTADYLAGLGYVIASTGNADTYDYKGITVKVKKAKSEFAAILKKDLTSQASGSAVVASVDDTITTDAAVIVGK